MSFSESVESIVAGDRTGLLGIHGTWKRVRLGEVASILNGFAFPSGQFTKGEGTPLIRIRDIADSGTEAWFRGDFEPQYLVEPGALLVGMDGDFNCALWRGPRALLNQRVCRVTPNETLFGKRFLQAALPAYLKAINDATSSVTVKHLSSRTLADLPLPLPPRAEQERIADEVEKQFTRLDAAVAGLQRVKANLKRYRASVLKAACEGRLVPTEAELARREGRSFESGEELLKRILKERRARWEATQLAKMKAAGRAPENDSWRSRYQPPLPPANSEGNSLPTGWVAASVDQLAEVGTGATPLRSDMSYYKGGEIPWVTSGALNEPFIRKPTEMVTRKALAATNLSLYPRHTLLLAMYGEGKTRGKCSELLIEATTNQAVAAIVALDTSSECRSFLKLSLEKQYEDLRREASGGVQPNLNLSLVRRISVDLPPLPEQERIVAEVERCLSVVDELEATVEKSLGRCARLRQSILKMAFEGRLVPQDPNEEPASVLLDRIRRERGPEEPRRRGVRRVPRP